MSGELQTIPARHGTATFVPRGHTIKIINTYGKQVVDTWAFALHDAPKDDPKQGTAEEEKMMAQAQEEAGKAEEVVANTEEKADGATEESTTKEATGEGKVTENLDDHDEEPSEEKLAEGSNLKPKKKSTPGGLPDQKAAEDATKGAAADTMEKADDASKTANSAIPKTWVSYIPSVRSKLKTGDATKTAEKTTEKAADAKDSSTRTWTSYIYSSSKPTNADEEAKAVANSKSWSSYIPSGQGFSSYLPDKSTLSAFATSHQRDPNKSYAEQLYEFSKTPVGAAGLSGMSYYVSNRNKLPPEDRRLMYYLAATGSGTASSIYAAYSAYQKLPHRDDEAPMEFMSMPHSRASASHLTPRVGDTMTSNLRQPMLTLIEDTSPGIHDTLMAACDPPRYKELGVKKWEEHGSCAENLVVALKELNEKSGLKGAKAVGADVTINTVPAPLNLFMNIPWTDKGDLKFAAPGGKKGDYVKFKAERDLVVVMSACPQDVLEINGKRSMVAHFMVEEPKEEREKREKREAVEEKESKKTKSTPKKPAPKLAERKASTPKATTSKKDTPAPKAATSSAKKTAPGAKASTEEGEKEALASPASSTTSATPKKKPPKLQRRTPASTPTKKE